MESVEEGGLNEGLFSVGTEKVCGKGGEKKIMLKYCILHFAYLSNLLGIIL